MRYMLALQKEVLIVCSDDLWKVYCKLLAIKRHMKNRNYGLMEEELNQLGLSVADEVEPPRGMGWRDQ